MCGFAGLYPLLPFESGAALRARVTAMADTLAHRGPDAASTTVLPFAAVGFRRLAIVGLTGGDQPATNRSGEVRVFCNGEIYNHEDLRQRLRRDQGIEVIGGSDAAVLPHLYECYGERFVELLNGMFAICVLDARDQSCRLYRDRLGIKPLYVAIARHAVVFGSELKPIWRSGLVPAAVAEDQVVPFLERFYAPGQRTLARGIERVMPGEFLVLHRAEAPRRQRYWSLAARREPITGNVLGQLDALLADSVRLQLMAERPIGISLSGGLDSSLLAYYVQRSAPNVSAYTITFPETTLDERRAAREVAQALRMPHVELTAQRGSYLQELEHAASFNDDPVADPAFVPAMQVTNAASAHVKVLLAGTGADELFAGYGHYALPWRARIFRMLAPVLGERAAISASGLQLDPSAFAALRQYGQSRQAWHSLAMSHLRPEDRVALATVPSADASAEVAHWFAEAQGAGLDPINQQLCVDAATYLPHQLLALLDRTTMAVSIEGRVPFLDHRLAEFALAISGARKLRFGRDKSLLRTLAHRHLPPTVARRRKRGFPNGIGEWLAPEHLPSVRERLLDRMAFARGFFPLRWLERTLAGGPDLAERALLLHSLLVLETWHRTFVASRSVPTTAPAPAPVPA